MTLLQNTAESGLAVGTVVDGMNSGGTAGDAFTTVAGTSITFGATAYKGTRGLHVDAAASDNVYVGWTVVAGATTAAAARGYINMAALPTPNAQAIANFRSSGGGAGLLTLMINAAGTLSVLSDVAGTTLGTSAGALSAATDYRWEIGFTNPTTTTGTVTLRVYLGDTTTVVASLDLTGVNLGTAAIGTARFGRPAAIGTAFAYDFDDVAFQTGSATLIGPSTLPNVSPTVDAGVDQTDVEPWATVTLTGTDSDSDGTIASRTWTRTAGPAVTLTGATTATATFEAPATIAGTTLTFSYTVTDDDGATGTDTVNVTVLPVTERAVIGGVEVPMQIRLM